MDLQTSLPSQLVKLRFLDRFMAGHAGFIAGGCFKGLFLGEKVKDIDVFFEKDADIVAAIEYFKGDDSFSPGYENDKVKSFRCKKTGILVELIIWQLNSPEDTISMFDFSITKAFYCKNAEGEYVFKCHEKFFEHLMNRKLVIDDKCLYPVSTFNRILRYTKYGFNLCGESKQKIVDSLQGHQMPSILDFYGGID